MQENLLKSRIDLLQKINTKPYLILYDDGHTKGQRKLHTESSDRTIGKNL